MTEQTHEPDMIAPGMIAPASNYLTADYRLRSWFLTTDHKRVALLYFAAITMFFAVGGAAAALIRLELVHPQGDLVTTDVYNRLFTMHGVVMVWFFLIPSIPNTLGNFIVPLMIGARDLAFPRLNLASWYLFVLGGAITLYAVFMGGLDTGWTFYTPFSTLYSNGHVVLAVVGVFVSGFSSILTGLNFIVTIHRLRAPGLTWYRLPLFLWSLYATSVILVLATPVLAMTLLLLGLERIFGLGIFDPRLGGDPLLFQHLFWFYSHPAVYIMILPAMGVISELISCFSRKPVFGYKFVAWASMAIAVVGFFVWGHHMFVSGQSVYAGVVFSFMSFVVAVPSAIKVFNWTATLHKGWVRFDAPMLYALGFIGLFTIGGLTGLFLACLAYDVYRHRHLFRGGAFPLHHGGRLGERVLRRLALLVAEDHRPALSGILGAGGRDPDLLRLQSHLLSAIHPRRARHAAALPRLSARAAGLERALFRRRLDPGARLCAAAVLSRLVVVLRAPRRPQSVAGDRPRVADHIAAAAAQLRAHARGGARSLLLHARRGGAAAKCLSRIPQPRLSICPSSTRRRSSGCGHSWRPRCCSSAGCCSPMRSTASAIRRILPPPRATPGSRSGPPTPRSC